MSPTTHRKCGLRTSSGAYCKQPAGIRTNHPGIGGCWLHDTKSKSQKTNIAIKQKCGAITNKGDRCKHPSGWGTFHQGFGKCHFHHEISVHESPKLDGGSCKPKSIYEEYALIKLRVDPDVSQYFYEPIYIPYNYKFMKKSLFSNYKPDILVIYKNKKPAIVEVKVIAEIYDSQNLAKFEAADKAAKSNNCHFEVWGFNSMDITTYTYQDIIEKCCFENHNGVVHKIVEVGSDLD